MGGSEILFYLMQKISELTKWPYIYFDHLFAELAPSDVAINMLDLLKNALKEKGLEVIGLLVVAQ